jgi:formylglycine-generating enzyme required for sulfatase activity
MGTSPEELDDVAALSGRLDIGPFAPEMPKHEVTVQPFLLDAHDVTNAAFVEFVRANPPWRRSAVREASPGTRYLEHWADDVSFDRKLAEHPVTFVTWYAAVVFCHAQGKRLPTEAEWEWASGGGRREFPWGDDEPSDDLVNWSGSGTGRTVPVASYPPNDFGLYDMSGNVWKFLGDSWRDSYADPPASRLGIREALASRDPTRRVVRGGSYGANRANLRVRYRDSHRPGDAREMVGFRCARDAPQ